MILLLFITYTLLTTAFSQTCGPDEIFIREQRVTQYSKEDGTRVKAHDREAHCRQIQVHNYFKDKTSQRFKNIEPNLKPWKVKEKEIIEKLMAQLPEWLKKYTIASLLRSTSGAFDNPAYTINQTRTIILSDAFFKSPTKLDILTHEVAHLAISDFTEEIKEFWQLSGWIHIKELQIKIPPSKLIINDSKESISEDFANHIEVYHFNPSYLKSFNPKMFEFLDRNIKEGPHENSFNHSFHTL